ncbi:MAG TPA: hypothetical protein VGU23_01705, partial [Acidobacteriaceae bacterium]|nr:hypothetical protein [Acidobacteriaceae bacterium]
AIVKGGVVLLHRTVDLAGGSGPAEVHEAASAEAPASAAEILSEGSMESPASEVAQAVSVAAAYFEDTLEAAPAVVLSAGPLGAEALIGVLDEAYRGMAPVAVQEMVERQMLGADAESAGRAGGVPLGWLAGVRGALAN